MAQISFRILGNPASSGGYTPLISKGEPLEADKVEIPYPNYTTDGECYGIKLYQDVISYALYTNPVKVTSFDGNRSAALNIYLYIPMGYIVTFEGEVVSPKHILDRLSEEFYTQFMTMKGGAGSATWSYKTQNIEDFSESKSLFVKIINEYTLQEKKQKYIVMNGPTEAYANVIVDSENNIAQLMLDPNYEQLSSYDRLFIVRNGETNSDTLSLTVPRPKIYKIYVNNSFVGQIKSDLQTITTNYQPTYNYKTAENYSFTLQDIRGGKFADRVTIDDINEVVNCIVIEKDKVVEWSVIIHVDGKPADPAFKEQLYKTIYLESSGAIKHIASDRIKLVGAEISKNWGFKNQEQNGYNVLFEKDESKRIILLSYTKKVVAPITSAQPKPIQGGGTNTTRVQKNEYSIIKFSLDDKNNEYSESDFRGTKLIIEKGTQNIIIPFYLKPYKKKGIHIFEDDVEVEHFIADKIFNNRIYVKSKNFTYECNIDRKGREIYLIPEKLPFFTRLKKTWWFKMVIILLLCIISGGVGFYVNNMLLQNKKETIEISDFNAKFKGYILNGQVFMNDGKPLGYILESNIYRSTNVNDEILGVYNHEGKMLTIGNPKSKSVQNEPQPSTQREPDTPSTDPTSLNSSSHPEKPVTSAPSGQDSQKLKNESIAWLNKIKDGTIKFDEIGQCTDWANNNSAAPNVTTIKNYCSKIQAVKDFLLSINLNSSTSEIIEKAKELNGQCPGDNLKKYRIILQKFYLRETGETDEQYMEKISKRIFSVTETEITSFTQLKEL